jgi:hypothetical protein
VESHDLASQAPLLPDLMSQFKFRLSRPQDQDLIQWLQMGEHSTIVLLRARVLLGIYAALGPALTRPVQRRLAEWFSFRDLQNRLMGVDPDRNVTRYFAYQGLPPYS